MAVTVNVYDNFHTKLFLGDMGSLDVDTIKGGLVTSSYTFVEATNAVWADASANEIAAGNGYVAGGKALTTVAVSLAAGTTKFDADDLAWTATGGAIPAHRRLVMYNDTVASPIIDPLMMTVLGDDAPYPAVLETRPQGQCWMP